MTILAVIAAIAMARTAYNGMTKKSDKEDTETVLVARQPTL
jgi:Tfp pilus assembly protein PilE